MPSFARANNPSADPLGALEDIWKNKEVDIVAVRPPFRLGAIGMSGRWRWISLVGSVSGAGGCEAVWGGWMAFDSLVGEGIWRQPGSVE